MVLRLADATEKACHEARDVRDKLLAEHLFGRLDFHHGGGLAIQALGEMGDRIGKRCAAELERLTETER